MSDTPAAGPWLAGDPPREGRYLVMYRQKGIVRPFIADWVAYPEGGHWASTLDAEILYWAEIHKPEGPT